MTEGEIRRVDQPSVTPPFAVPSHSSLSLTILWALRMANMVFYSRLEKKCDLVQNLCHPVTKARKRMGQETASSDYGNALRRDEHTVRAKLSVWQSRWPGWHRYPCKRRPCGESQLLDMHVQFSIFCSRRAINL